MHQSVLDHFVDFTAPLEGVVYWPYLDIKGLVTVGIGDLIDPVELAIGLPWLLPDGSTPSPQVVRAQWHDLKAQTRLARLHYKYASTVTTIRLSNQGIADLVRSRLLANEQVLRTYFKTWDLWPADAQLAACSMAWAVGAGFPHTFGNFTAAANAQDWRGALAACAIRTDGNPGIVPRNAANRLCLANAAAVVAQGLPLDSLFWPGTPPNASQRDVQIRLDAELALANHALAIAGHTDDVGDSIATEVST